MYQGVQKLLVLIMIPIEAIPQTYGFLDPMEFLIDSYGMGWANFVIVAQLFAGSYLVFLLDELVSKWGIGSGMSLVHRSRCITVNICWYTIATTCH